MRENKGKAYQGRKNGRRRQELLRRCCITFTAIILATGLGVFLCGSFADAHDETSAQGETHKYYKSIEITKGDTLWDIADEYQTEEYASIYEYIDELKSMNGLTTDEIHEGQFLTVAYYQ